MLVIVEPLMVVLMMPAMMIRGIGTVLMLGLQGRARGQRQARYRLVAAGGRGASGGGRC